MTWTSKLPVRCGTFTVSEKSSQKPPGLSASVPGVLHSGSDGPVVEAACCGPVHETDVPSGGPIVPELGVAPEVAGVPISAAQLEYALERERVRTEAAGRRFPDRDSDEFKGLRHRLLERLVLDVEIVKSANRLEVAVPTAAVYEFAEEASGEEGEAGGEEAAGVERSAVPARLLYE